MEACNSTALGPSQISYCTVQLYVQACTCETSSQTRDPPSADDEHNYVRELDHNQKLSTRQRRPTITTDKPSSNVTCRAPPPRRSPPPKTGQRCNTRCQRTSYSNNCNYSNNPSFEQTKQAASTQGRRQQVTAFPFVLQAISYDQYLHSNTKRLN